MCCRGPVTARTPPEGARGPSHQPLKACDRLPHTLVLPPVHNHLLSRASWPQGSTGTDPPVLQPDVTLWCLGPLGFSLECKGFLQEMCLALKYIHLLQALTRHALGSSALRSRISSGMRVYAVLSQATRLMLFIYSVPVTIDNRGSSASRLWQALPFICAWAAVYFSFTVGPSEDATPKPAKHTMFAGAQCVVATPVRSGCLCALSAHVGVRHELQVGVKVMGILSYSQRKAHLRLPLCDEWSRQLPANWT